MKRTGIKINTDEDGKPISLRLFNEDNPNQSLAIMLDPTQVIAVINQLLRATETVKDRPKKKHR